MGAQAGKGPSVPDGITDIKSPTRSLIPFRDRRASTCSARTVSVSHHARVATKTLKSDSTIKIAFPIPTVPKNRCLIPTVPYDRKNPDKTEK
jgi:hypothetical protein